MKNIFILTIILCSGFCVKAQDIIYQKKRGTIEAKVETIKKATVVYRRVDNPDGPLYELEKGYIDSIVYENGTVEYFNVRKGPPRPGRHERLYEGEAEPKPKRMRNPAYSNPWSRQFSGAFRIISPQAEYDFGSQGELKEPALYGLMLTYEKDFLHNWLGVGISPFIAVNRSAIGGIVDVKANLRRSGRVRISTGGEYILSRENVITGYTTGNYSDFITRRYKTTLSRLLFTGEFDFHFTPRVFLRTDFGIGGVISNSDKKKNLPHGWAADGNGDEVSGFFGMGVGYRF